MHKGSWGSVCAHIRVAGEIRAMGNVPVFGIGGKDKYTRTAAQREARKREC